MTFESYHMSQMRIVNILELLLCSQSVDLPLLLIILNYFHLILYDVTYAIETTIK
jgi:hypothetical protein